MKNFLFCYLIVFSIKLFESSEGNFEQIKIGTNGEEISNDKETNRLIQDYFDQINKIELTEEELDKLIFCGTINQIKLHNDEKIINEVIERIQENQYLVNDKIANYLANKCFKTIDLETARKVAVNGLYIVNITDDLYNKYKSYFVYDYAAIRNKDDLAKTEEEIQISYKIYKAFQIHEARDKREKKSDDEPKNNREQRKGKLDVGIEFLNIPTYIKGTIFIIVFGLIFGGILYYVNIITKKQNKEKNKKKKKKN